MSRHMRLQHLVEARIDDKKFEELKQMLSESKYRYMSELVRAILYDKKVEIVTYDKSLGKVMEQLTFIRSELHAIGVNINQVTKYFNSDPKPSQKVYYSMQVATLYQNVGKKADELLLLIAKLGEKWLQK